MNLNKILMIVSLSIFSQLFGMLCPVYSQDKGINVTFKNGSKNALLCEIFRGNDYVPFIMIDGKQKRHFDGFKSGSKIRCNIATSNTSFTFLTYFVVTSAGVYELLLAKVPCSSCGNQDWRWATTVVYPNGQADYTK